MPREDPKPGQYIYYRSQPGYYWFVESIKANPDRPGKIAKLVYFNPSGRHKNRVEYWREDTGWASEVSFADEEEMAMVILSWL